MPEYLAPGVYVEEMPFQVKPIEGVSTSDGAYVEETPFRATSIEGVSISDQKIKYVNIRRYPAYLEESIVKATQWAAFEPNGDALWGKVRETVRDFLFNEWKSGVLLGDDSKKAYFVKCDRSTMSQDDLENGRLVCLIGVAIVKPAEFEIFRIEQWTADRKM